MNGSIRKYPTDEQYELPLISIEKLNSKEIKVSNPSLHNVFILPSLSLSCVTEAGPTLLLPIMDNGRGPSGTWGKVEKTQVKRKSPWFQVHQDAHLQLLWRCFHEGVSFFPYVRVEYDCPHSCSSVSSQGLALTSQDITRVHIHME